MSADPMASRLSKRMEREAAARRWRRTLVLAARAIGALLAVKLVLHLLFSA